MTKTLNADDANFRKLVTSLDGSQKLIAEALGITQTSVAARLRSEKHHKWWIDFKATRSRKRRQARSRRAYAAAKARLTRAQEDVADPAGAMERALTRALAESL